jgi:hypothetical protein
MPIICSHAALNKIQSGAMRELNDYIGHRLDKTVGASEPPKPLGLHFLVQDKIFKGTNQPFVSCPIQLLLSNRSLETKLCQPVWTDATKRSKVNRKVRMGVKRHSVIRLDDFSVVAHAKYISGSVFFIRKFTVVKKDVDDDAYLRWITE